MQRKGAGKVCRLVIGISILLSIVITIMFSLKQHIPQNHRFVEDNQRFHTITSQDDAHLCKEAKPLPAKNVHLRNGYYQYFINSKLNTTKYFVGVYYDDRQIMAGMRPLVRIHMLITVPHQAPLFDLKQCQAMPVYLMYWHETPMSVKCRCMIIFTAKRWEVNKLKYYVSHWECSLPSSINITNVRVSVTDEQCKDKPTTYTEITVPEKPVPGHDSKQVAFIMKGWYGNWTKKFAPYLVSWMETMKHFGIVHLHASKDALYLNDEIIQKAVKYYQDIKFLSLPTIPTNFDETSKPYTNFSIDQIGTFLTVNDIFYKKLHHYWYVIHADIDEIIVPKIAPTYSTTLHYILKKYPNCTSAASIAAPMAHFYMNYEPLNPSIPKHAPLLRQTYRTPVERMLIHGKVFLDSPKSFINPRTCLLVGIHYCYFTYFHHINKVEMGVGVDVFMLHHYRRSCKKTEDQCHTDWQKRLADSQLYKVHGNKLIYNVETVLKKIGYL